MKLAIFSKKLDYITFEAQMSYYAEYDIQIIYNFLCDQTCHIKGGELSLLNCAWLPPGKEVQASRTWQQITQQTKHNNPTSLI